MGRFSWCATSSDSEPEIPDELWDEGPYYDYVRGFPSACQYCDGKMALQTERDPNFAGRLRYRCVNHDDGGQNHQSKWWDLAVHEELEDMKTKVDEQREETRNLTINKEVQLHEQAELLFRLKTTEDSITSLRSALADCSKQIFDLKEELTNRLPATEDLPPSKTRKCH